MMRQMRVTWAETGGGLFLVAVGLGVVWIAWGYDLGSLRRMGPGFMPVMVGVCLALLGLGIALRPETPETPDTDAEADAEDTSPNGFQRLKAPVLVFAAIAAWAALLMPGGLILATLALTLISAFAHPHPNPARIAISAVVLPALAVVLFIYALRLPLSPWPMGF